MIKIRQKGDFARTEKYFKNLLGSVDVKILEKYGKAGVSALSSATPVDTGLTAASWTYRIVKDNGKIGLEFYNTNVENGVPVAIVVQYGHATKNGGWVEGIDYINPAIKPIFEKMALEIWKEVKKA